MSSYEFIQIEMIDGIAKIVLNRPKALNALNSQVLNELTGVFQSLGANQSVRGALITGAGEKAFVAGADISEMKDAKPEHVRAFCDLGHRTFRLIVTSPFPVLAAVNGFALGGGLELALACDFIYAADVAKLGLPEVNLGIFPGFGGTQRLMSAIGIRRAKEMIYSTTPITAAKAYEWGLVNRICTPQTLIDDSMATLKTIASKGPVAVRTVKSVIDGGRNLPYLQGLDLERTEFPKIFETADSREGISAFLEKRTAQFNNN